MLPNNKCGLVIKRSTTDVFSPDDYKLDIKISGKMAKRLGDDHDLI